MTPAEIRGFMVALAADRPVPRTELTYHDPFTLLVAVALSAQTTDAAVNRATLGLFEAARTPAALLALGEAAVARHIRSLGLWQAKTRAILALSRLLVERHGGAVPSDRGALEALPGVGRKTANVVLNVAFGETTLAVDTHVFRVANRTGLAIGPTVRSVEDGLMARLPREYLGHAHHWIILHGRYVCVARRPRCSDCVGNAWCQYPGKTLPMPAHAAT